MKPRYATLALVIAADVGCAAAQTPPTGPGPGHDGISDPLVGTRSAPLAAPASELRLTGAQKTAIANAIRRDGRERASPINFATSIGAPVPPSIELYILPDAALAEVPEAKIVKYTRVQNQIVLVDPTTMRVVDVLPGANR